MLLIKYKNMQKLSAVCPICDTQVVVDNNVEVSEIMACPDCRSRLVVEKIENGILTLIKAPVVEEDWGE